MSTIERDEIVVHSLDANETALLMDVVADQQRERLQVSNSALREVVKGVLMASQIRWISDKSDVRVWEKSRRIGCTWSCAAEAVLEASKQRGMSQYYMGYNLGMAAEFIGDCAMFARAFGLAISAIGVNRETHFIRNERKDITLYRVRFANGRVIEALSSNPLNWRGRQGHARIDEAGHIAGLRALVDAALAWLLWGGRVSITGTHNGEGSEFHELIAECKAGPLDYSLHYTDFDQALEEGFYKRVCLRTGKDWSLEDQVAFREKAFKRYIDKDRADEELLCIPRKASGEYMSRVMLEQASVPAPREVFAADDSLVLDADRRIKSSVWWLQHVWPALKLLDPTRRHVFGQDFARSADATGVLICAEISAGQWHPAVYFEMRNAPFDVQELLIGKTLAAVPRLKRAKFDARGNGQSTAEKMRQSPLFGHLVDEVMVSGSFYSEHFPRYRAALQSKRFCILKHSDVLDDHRLIQLVKAEPRIVSKRTRSSVDDSSRHGDSMVAHFMAYLATVDQFEAPAGGQVQPTSQTYAAQRPGHQKYEPLVERQNREGLGLRQRVRGFIAKSLRGRL